MLDLLASLPALLQNYDLRLRQEAERLVDDDAVRGLDSYADETLAEVRLDEARVNIRWGFEDGKWGGESDAEEPLNSLALCTALIALQRRMARLAESAQKPDEPAEETLQVILERRLARQLTPDEEAYLSKLEKRFQRVLQTGEIFDQDMVRLHPKWRIESLDPVPLWPEPPTTLREFWDYVALALHDKGLPLPSFLRGIADLEGTRERLRDWKRARSVPIWMERIRHFSEQQASSRRTKRQTRQIRLLITPTEARLQMHEDESYRNCGMDDLRQLKSLHGQGSLSLTVESELLLLACLAQRESSSDGAFRLESAENSRWLGALFLQPRLRQELVTLDETPFHFPDEPLIWKHAAEDKDSSRISLRLIKANGDPTPIPLRILHGAETLYLSADTVFRGPPWLEDETEVAGDVVIPADALYSADGIAFLGRLDVPLPAQIASRVKEEPLTVKVKAHCMAKSPMSGAEFAVFKMEAVSPEGQVREIFSSDGWTPVQQDAPPSPRSQKVILCHDRSTLREAQSQLEELRPIFDTEQEGFRVRLTKSFPDQFNTWSEQLPESMRLECDERLHSILADPLIARVRLEASQTAVIDWFDLKMIFEIEGMDLKPAEIRRLIAAKGGYVQLADGMWRRVKLELTEEQQVMMDQLGLDIEEFGDEAHRLHWRQLAGQTAKEFINPRAWQNITQRMENAKLDEKPEVPATLNVTLRPYQLEGFHFLSYLSINKFGGILADDMGLGKTIQSITWLLWLRSRYRNAWPCIVVCPKSVLDVWATEFGKAAPTLRVQVLRDKDELDLEKLHNDCDILVLNYAQLRGCIELLEAVKFLAVILDEGQQIKNPDSKAAKAARQLKSENRLVLTGTPLENRLLDLWSLMTFATPGALGDRSYFHRHFDRRKDVKASERLAARLKPFLLRRTKGQVAKELPSRTEEAMLCSMSGTQERLYREELAKAQHMVISASGFEVLTRKRFAILQALTRLRQICCHPALVDKSAEKDESAKLTATLELIEELHAEGHKVLLFSQFVSMLEIIRDQLDEMRIPHYWLTGSTNNRSEVVQRFQEDEDACVFLLSLKAGGSGLNLTAASYVILYDPWWNPAVEAQAIDRAHRIGQTQPVMAYRMITKGTIEEKIMLLQQKKNLMSANILGEGSFTSTLEKADFEFLFGLEAEEKMRQED